MSVSPGTLYPALHRLEERELIEAEWGESENNRRARFYKLTASGRKQIAAESKGWKRVSGAVDIVLRDG